MLNKKFQFKIPKYFNLTLDCIEKWDQHSSIKRKTALYEVDNNLKVKKITYSDLNKKIKLYSHFLKENKIKKGDRVVLRLENSTEFIICFLSIVKIGGIAIPTSTMLKKNELEIIIKKTTPKAVISDTLINFFKENKIKILRKEILNIKTKTNFLDYSEKTLANDPCYICFTSGSTGDPKGVLHAHRSILGREPSTRFWLRLKQDDIVFNPGKLNWTYSLGAGCLDCLRFGSTVIIYSGNHDINNYLNIIKKFNVSIFMTVPGVFRQINRYLNENKNNIKKLTPVNKFISAGEHLDKELILAWKKKTNKFIYEGLGMSEISYFISNDPNKKIKPGSSGKIQPGHSAKIINNNSRRVKTGEIGELVIDKNDPGLMLGYWKDKISTDKKIKKNFFHTGDLFKIDKDNFLWFISRKDEIINAFGYRISPIEIETTVNKLNFVQESALCVKKKDGKEITSLNIVIDNDNEKTIKRNKIKNFLQKELADYKLPKEIIIVSKIKKTKTGKIIRKTN